MSLERIHHIIQRFRAEVTGHAPSPRPLGIEPKVALELFESMLLARHLDRAAHELRAKDLGYYTISSAGHEANVVLGRLTRTSDPSLLHYRSAALQLERARQTPSCDPVLDIALSLVASADEPLCSGRHKVFGSKQLGILPQTSTIASHLPRAVGLGFGIELARQLRVAQRPVDAVAMASFGDASVNHSTAQGAFNAAGWVAHQNLHLPLLFVCEDNGLGISVRTPPGWIALRLKHLPHIRYFTARGWELTEAYQVADQALHYCRTQRRPAILHLQCVRLLGHAGSDVDSSYRSSDELEAARLCDPVRTTALSLLDAEAASPAEILALDRKAEARVEAAVAEAIKAPKLKHRADVMAHLAPGGRGQVRTSTEPEPRTRVEAPAQPSEARYTLAQAINRVLVESLSNIPGLLIFGEDVAKKGGVYGVTKGLLAKFGPRRVFNTLLDEQTIIGIALGTASLGLLPMPEIQYLAYLHNAEDQLRGEAATMQFFSNAAFDNPMVVRIAGLAYQKGFGGHFHNDNSLAVLRDIPGLALAVPARADDAFEVYRRAIDLSQNERRVVVVVEPIARYHTRDLFDKGDDAWLAPEPRSKQTGSLTRTYTTPSANLLIITYGNGVYLSLRARRRLERDYQIRPRIVDLRWLAPLPLEELIGHCRELRRVLIVDECRQTGSLSEGLMAKLVEAAPGVSLGRVTSADCFIPLAEAANLVLLSEQDIIDAARRVSAESPESLTT